MSEANAKPAEKVRKPSVLNRFFHHIDRGSTTGREIGAGILACILSVCGIFINMQLIARFFISGSATTATVAQIAENGEIFAQLYFVSMIISFVSSLLIGLVARLPLVQLPSLGLSTVLISTLGIGANLSYYNLMAVCFVSSLVYAVIAAVPVIRRAVFGAIPQAVRRALPAAVGVLLVFTAMQLTGLISMGGTDVVIQGVGTSLTRMEGVTETVQQSRLFDFGGYLSLGYKADAYYPLVMICLLSVLVAFAAYLLLRKTKHPLLYALLAGTVFYFAGMLSRVVFYVNKSGALKYELDSLWGRLWMVGSEDAMHLHIGRVLSNLKIGEFFAQGFDFTAYAEAGGSVALLFATGVLTFLFLNMGTADATLQATDTTDEKAHGMALACSAGMNVIAPLAGMTPLAISPVSVAAKRDGARSGLASVVAAIGLLLSAFVWLVPFLFATTTSYDIYFNLYGHYGTVMQLMTETSFIVADAVMVLVGLVMIAKSLQGDWTAGREIAPLLVTVAATFFMGSLACGAAAGMLAHLLVSVFDKERSLTLGNVLAALVSIALLALTVAL